MFRSWKIGTAFGIPLYIHPTIVLLPALVFATQWDGGWFNALVMTVLTAALFGCVLLHELGHAATALLFGIRTHDITLYPIGGVASLERMTEKPLQEMAVAVAGPAVNLVIALLLLPLVVLGAAAGLLGGDVTAFRLADGLGETASKFTLLLTAMNIGLILFNLIPAFPMDGGRVFRAFLALLMNRVRATEIASGVGAVLAGLFIVAGLASLFGLASFFTDYANPLLALVGAFVLFAGRMELLGVRRQAEQARLADAWDDSPEAPIVEAAPGFSGYRWDRRDHVWVLWRNGRPIEVYDGGAE
ncbi:MAG TPA: site-2 protease family protein [Gemmataceae bacterium]|nr:site-2 protease family protein [Gemmataceae bacterium]